MFSKYTAHLRLGDHKIVEKSSNDLKSLTIQALIHMDDFAGIVNGTIQDNLTGRVVHRCNKSNV